MSEQHPRPTEQLWTLATALANAITGRHSSKDGEAPGVVFFESYRGEYCPTCYPQWNDERAGYSHEEECPMWQFYRLVLDRPAPPT